LSILYQVTTCFQNLCKVLRFFLLVDSPPRQFFGQEPGYNFYFSHQQLHPSQGFFGLNPCQKIVQRLVGQVPHLPVNLRA